MIPKPIDQITSADIDALIENGVVEGRSLEYKRELPGGGDEDKREFLADVASLANAGGGDLIFGVDEERDTSGRPTGRPRAVYGLGGANLGAEILRLTGIAQTGIDPRILALHARELTGWQAGDVLVIRVPRSWSTPHMVTFKNLSRFFSRNSAGKYQLDVREIRSAFLVSHEFGQWMTAHRAERLGAIADGETPVVLLANPKVVLHVIPANAHPGFGSANLSSEQLEPGLLPVYQGGAPGRFTFDGFLTPTAFADPPRRHGYVLFQRNAVIEAVDASLIRDRGGSAGTRIASLTFEKQLITSTARYVSRLRDAGVPLPYYVLLTMLGVRGYEMGVGSSYAEWEPTPIDRDSLVIPECVLESYETPVDVLLHPALDVVWQACGFPGSLRYDANGRWVER